MALLCKQCYADVTDAIEQASPQRKFRCKCGSGTFFRQNDDPTVPYVINENDRKFFLKPFKIQE